MTGCYLLTVAQLSTLSSPPCLLSSLSLCKWIFNLVIGRPQSERIRNYLIFSPSAQEHPKAVFSVLCYVHPIPTTVARCSSNAIFNFAKDTFIISWIMDNDESECRRDIENSIGARAIILLSTSTRPKGRLLTLEEGGQGSTTLPSSMDCSGVNQLLKSFLRCTWRPVLGPWSTTLMQS